MQISSARRWLFAVLLCGVAIYLVASIESDEPIVTTLPVLPTASNSAGELPAVAKEAADEIANEFVDVQIQNELDHDPHVTTNDENQVESFATDPARVASLFRGPGSNAFPSYLEELLLTENVDEMWAENTVKQINSTLYSAFSLERTSVFTECLQTICYSDIAMSSLPIRRMTSKQRESILANLPPDLFEQVVFVRDATDIQRAFFVRTTFDVVAAERAIGRGN